MEVSYLSALKLTASAESWESLSAGQKILALQAIEDHVADEQGRIACPVNAQWLDPVDGGVEMGHYEPSEMRIVVNAEQLVSTPHEGASPDEMVKTVLHEGRHAYQDQAVKGVIACEPSLASKWSDNMRDYISFKENPKQYWAQPIEADARKYADGRLEVLTRERNGIIAAKSESLKGLANNGSGEDRLDSKAAFLRQAQERSEVAEAPCAADFRSAKDETDSPSEHRLGGASEGQLAARGISVGR